MNLAQVKSSLLLEIKYEWLQRTSKGLLFIKYVTRSHAVFSVSSTKYITLACIQWQMTYYKVDQVMCCLNPKHTGIRWETDINERTWENIGKHLLGSGQLLPIDPWVPYAWSFIFQRKLEMQSIIYIIIRSIIHIIENNSVWVEYIFLAKLSYELPVGVPVSFVFSEEMPTRSGWLSAWAGHLCRLEAVLWKAAAGSVSRISRGLKGEWILQLANNVAFIQGDRLIGQQAMSSLNQRRNMHVVVPLPYCWHV